MDDQYRTPINLNARVALHRLFGVNKYGWMPWIFDHNDFPDHCRILELGCGTGNLWVENLHRIKPGWQLTLTDHSPGMVAESQSRLQDIAVQCEFKVVDAQDIPFADNHFDIVLANHMLYHVPDMARGIAEIRRVVKTDGQLYASTIGMEHMHELFELLTHLDVTIDFQCKFTLENGEECLSPWFEDIRQFRYKDALAVTEVEPVIAYALSMPMDSVNSLTDTQVAALRQHIQQSIETLGEFHISKSEGMFVATAH